SNTLQQKRCVGSVSRQQDIFLQLLHSACVICTRIFPVFYYEKNVMLLFSQPYPIFFTDVVQLKAPGMGPDSAEHLEILEEFRSCSAPAPFQSIPHTCTQGEKQAQARRWMCVRLTSSMLSISSQAQMIKENV
ncbi:hypothetical protein XENOCAPTIV_002000, partial [Xenoophorus captivus]